VRELSKTITSKICRFEDLNLGQQELLVFAANVREKAQAPYSHFFVGVAVESLAGYWYSGCNVERASWTQTTHAEQNAIDSMVAEEGPSKIVRLALVAAPEGVDVDLNVEPGEPIQSVDQVLVPCGHCLQIIWENCFNDGSVEIISRCANGEIAITTMDSAFPIKFGPHDLGVDYGKLGKV